MATLVNLKRFLKRPTYLDGTCYLPQCSKLFLENPSNTFFFIKKGITPKYLVSRVGYYRFDPTFPYCHRIAFEFVRLANNKENQPLVGLGVKTIASVNTTHGTVTELLG